MFAFSAAVPVCSPYPHISWHEGMCACACTDLSGQAHICVCMGLFKHRFAESLGVGRAGPAATGAPVGRRGSGGLGGRDDHQGRVSLKSPLPSASAPSMTLKYFHLLWELPVQFPVVLGLFILSFFLRL